MMDRTLDNGRWMGRENWIFAVKIYSFTYLIDYNELRRVPMSILNLVLGNAVQCKTCNL